jgi:hypothetical protein
MRRFHLFAGARHETVRQNLPPRRDAAPGYDSRGSTEIAEATHADLGPKMSSA